MRTYAHAVDDTTVTNVLLDTKSTRAGTRRASRGGKEKKTVMHDTPFGEGCPAHAFTQRVPSQHAGTAVQRARCRWARTGAADQGAAAGSVAL